MCVAFVPEQSRAKRIYRVCVFGATELLTDSHRMSLDVLVSFVNCIKMSQESGPLFYDYYPHRPLSLRACSQHQIKSL